MQGQHLLLQPKNSISWTYSVRTSSPIVCELSKKLLIYLIFDRMEADSEKGLSISITRFVYSGDSILASKGCRSGLYKDEHLDISMLIVEFGLCCC